MKIAFIVTHFPALSETFILKQITGLLNLGHDVEIFAFNNPGEEKVHSDVEKYRLMERVHYFSDDTVAYNGIHYLFKAAHVIKNYFFKFPLKILKSLNVFQYKIDAPLFFLLYATSCFLDKKFDVINCHFGPNGIIGIKLKEIGIEGKIVTVFHGFDMSRYVSEKGNKVYDRLFLECDLCMPISDYWKKKLIEMGCSEDKIIVHRMGIDLDKFKFLKRKLLPGKTIKILSVGRLIEKKGYEFTIRAIANVIDRYKHITYYIAGDGPLRNKLEDLVSELGVKKYVKFLGALNQEEVLKFYEQAHVFVLSSITANNEKEGIPVVLMEAHASGLPVISTYHSGIPELVVDKKSGFLVPEKNIDSLAEKIEYFIDHPDVIPEMGSYGRKIVEDNFNIRKLNQQLVDIYSDLIGH